MDKQEYQEIIDGIKKGYAHGDYERVLMFAREISPRKIRETKILEMISNAYDAVGKPGLARQTLEIAYERMQNGKQIAYKLAEMCIRLKDIDSAVKYYEDFCRVAPNDNRRYVLKYEIATAGGLTIYDRIKILEEYTQKEIDEEGLYELARLYHEAGMGDQCAATVDEFTIWFSDGDFIKRALELKFAHTPLSPKQQALYENLMSEFMEDDEIFLNNPNEQPVVDAFDEEAEEFAKRYLNGTLENTKSIDTQAINAAIEEAAIEAGTEIQQPEQREIAATKKLSLNESAALAAMAAKEHAQAETVAERAPAREPVRVPERVEFKQDNLNLNINPEEDYNIEGQMTIDQMFEMYTNNMENNEAAKAAVENVEAERLRQIRESVESSIKTTPLLDIEEEPEPEPVVPVTPVVVAPVQSQVNAPKTAVPEKPEPAVPAQPQVSAPKTAIPEKPAVSVPKTAAEKLPEDATIEDMLAAMGEEIELSVAEPVAPEKPAAPVVPEKPAAPVITEEAAPVIEDNKKPEVSDEEIEAMAAAAAGVGMVTAAEAAKARRMEEREMKHDLKKAEREAKHEQKKAEREIKQEQKKAEKEMKAAKAAAVAAVAGGVIASEAAAEKEEPKQELLFDVEPKQEEYVITNTIEDTPSIEAEVDAIMAELPIADFVKEPEVKNNKPNVAYQEPDLDSLEAAMDDIMAELPFDDFKVDSKAEVEKELDKELDALMDEFPFDDFAVPEPESVIPEPKPVAKEEIAPEPKAAVKEEPAPEPKAIVKEEPAPEPKAAVKEEITPEPKTIAREEPAPEPKAVIEEVVIPQPEETVKEEPAPEPEAVIKEVIIPQPEPVIKKETAPEIEIIDEEPVPVPKASVEERTPDINEDIRTVASLEEIGDFLEGEFINKEAAGNGIPENASPLELDKIKTAETDLDEDLEAAMDDIMSEMPLGDLSKVNMETLDQDVKSVDVVDVIDEGIEPVIAPAFEEPVQELVPEYRITDEIQEDLAEFLLVTGMQESIETAIGNIAYIKRKGCLNGGNLIVTGDAKSGKTFLAITVVKAVTQELGEGNGRVAKVQATSINGKNINKIFEKVAGNDLIIENVGDLDEETLLSVIAAMKDGTAQNMVVFEGNVLAIETIINNHPEVEELFENRIDIKELSISQWADVACDYASQKGYNVSDMALLALHAKIDEINMPTMRFGYEDAVNIIDRAIANANRRGTGRLFSAYKKDSSRKIDLIEADFDK